MTTLAALIALAGALVAAWVAVVSRREGERTAARRARDAGAVWLAVWLALAWVPLPGLHFVGLALAGGMGALALAVLVPTGRPRRFAATAPTGRLDERTAMFSRAAMTGDPGRRERYYAEYPEHAETDAAWRALPGLLSPGAHRAEPVAFAATAASFDAVERLADLVAGEPASARHELDAAAAARFVKGWARKLGAVDCGITPLRPHHLYAVRGRGPRWGEPVALDHAWAVAVTVEMDHAMLAAAPEAATVMESAQQYLESGEIAVQLAGAIRRLGWPAEAHIDANYQVVCPLVAQDAGLGEIGRLGLLMTPGLGPRVRIAVVTTDLPLVADGPADDPAVPDFCRICRKCADICPARAVPAGPPVEVDGVTRWRIDQEACYAYWCRSGTDCGQCVRVCPHAHPGGPLHDLVRRGVRHSALFRRLALRGDDLLYGRRPAPRRGPDWLPPRER